MYPGQTDNARSSLKEDRTAYSSLSYGNSGSALEEELETELDLAGGGGALRGAQPNPTKLRVRVSVPGIKVGRETSGMRRLHANAARPVCESSQVRENRWFKEETHAARWGLLRGYSGKATKWVDFVVTDSTRRESCHTLSVVRNWIGVKRQMVEKYTTIGVSPARWEGFGARAGAVAVGCAEGFAVDFA